MKQIPFTNNATTTLSAGITAVATTINLTPGHGARLPSLTAGQFFMATMVNAGGTLEIVKVTARVVDALTVVRAQEGTAGFAFSGGDKLEQRLTAAEVGEVVSLGAAENQLTAGGTVDALTATLVTNQTVLTDGMRVSVWASGANLTTTPTFALTLGTTNTGAITIVKNNNVALGVGDIPGANAELDLVYNAGLNRWVMANRGPVLGVPTLSSITNSLGADVALNNTANYFDGPSVAQGTVGTWFVSGTVTCFDGSGATMRVKLWDGTTVIASGRADVGAATPVAAISLSGVISSPAGNLRMSVKDVSTVGGLIMFNTTANSKDSTITAMRIA